LYLYLAGFCSSATGRWLSRSGGITGESGGVDGVEVSHRGGRRAAEHLHEVKQVLGVEDFVEDPVDP
jgi:hypothetical protein